jgi:O-antigen biosynthesis protein
VAREVTAVTGACCLIRRSIFDRVNGFDETLHVAFNDVDFCMRVGAAGFQNIYTPVAQLMHEEGASRGKLNPTLDAAGFHEKWGEDDDLHDRFVSPHVLFPEPMKLRLRRDEQGE